MTILLSDLADALHTLAVLASFGTLDSLVIQQAVDGLAGRAIIGIAESLGKLLCGELVRQTHETLFKACCTTPERSGIHVDETNIKFRLSTHPANGDRMSNDEMDLGISVLVYKNGSHSSDGTIP